MSRSGRVAFVLAATIAIVLLLTLIQLRGPSPEPAGAPPDHFSAVRAMSAFRATIGGTVPHPIGSAANRAIRDRIVAQFTALGYEARVVRAFACDGRGVCGTVENITARPPGQPGGPTVVAVAHYDSVPAGPGASDDGTGVAAMLEMARAVRAEHFRNPVMFLIDDGEEAGLLGAEAFVQSPVARFVSAVVNVEARGTSGPSFLFETSRNNRWFVPAIAAALPRPATSSLFPAIYDLLPNDTDLTVFKRMGLAGANFAYIGDVENYHTPNDDIRHVDLRSVQHQGENALAALRVFANADLSKRSTGNAVWFDVLGFFVIWWPSWASLPAAILSVLVSIVAAALLTRDGEATFREIAAGLIALAASVVAALILGAVIGFASSLHAGRMTWVAHPLPSIAAAWLAGVVASLLVIGAFRRRARCAGVVAGIAIAWNALAIVVSVILPGASYLFLVPGVALSVVAIVRSMEIADDTPGLIICAAIAAILWFPFATAVYESLGTPSLVAIAIVLALVATTFAPLFDRIPARVLGTAAIALLLLAGIAAILPAASARNPRRVPITWLDDGARTQWIAGTATDRMRQVAHFSATGERLFAWTVRPTRIFAAPAPPLPLLPVSITKIADAHRGRHVLTLHVASQRGAQRVSLFFSTRDTVDTLRIDGHLLPPLTRGRHFLAPQWHIASVRGGEAMDVEITTRGRSPIETYAIDTSFGLPPQGRSLAAARNASHAVTSDDGDVTATMRGAKF